MNTRGRTNKFLTLHRFLQDFDSIWNKSLIDKLCKYQLQGKLLKTINNFLFSRQVRLKVDRELGQRWSCGWFGLPQGSVLAPLLLILYFADLHPTCGHSIMLQTSKESCESDGSGTTDFRKHFLTYVEIYPMTSKYSSLLLSLICGIHHPIHPKLGRK